MVNDDQLMLEYNFIICVTELLERAMERESFIILNDESCFLMFPCGFLPNSDVSAGFLTPGIPQPFCAQVDVFATGAVWCQLAAGSRAMSFFRTWGPGNMEKIGVFYCFGDPLR